MHAVRIYCQLRARCAQRSLAKCKMRDILLQSPHGKIPWRYVWEDLGTVLQDNVLYLPGQEQPGWLLEMTQDTWNPNVVDRLRRANFEITDRLAGDPQQTVSQGLYDALRRYLALNIASIHEEKVWQDNGDWRPTWIVAIDDVVWYVHDLDSNGFPLWRPVKYVSKRN